MYKTSNYIWKAVSEIFPVIKVNEKSGLRFYEHVMIPAAELAAKIQLSPSSYSLWLSDESMVDPNPIKLKNLRDGRFIDLTTRKLLKPKDAVESEEIQTIAEVITPLEPGLQRNNEGKKPTILRDETFLVLVDRQSKKRQETSRPKSNLSAATHISGHLLDIP